MPSRRPAMNYIRCGLAVVFGAIFPMMLLVSLALIRLNGTLLEPRFYPDLMQRNEVYRFLMGEGLTTAIDEARRVDSRRFGGIFPENPIVTSGLTTRQIVEAVHRGMSSRDLERLASPFLLQIGEFLRGDRDSIAVKLEVGTHVRDVTNEVHKLLRESGSYALLIEHVLEPRVREAAGEMLGSNENVSVWMLYLFRDAEDAEDRMVQVMITTLTAGWLADQVERALEEFTAYLMGETDSFEIRIKLTGAEVENAVEETKSVLRDVDAYELVYPGVVEPVLMEVLGAGVRLPYGVSVTSDEVMWALRQAAPPSWVQRQAENLIDQVGPYVVGASEGFSTEIDLRRNKQQAADALADVAVGSVLETLSALPLCGTRAEVTAARRRLEQALPDCIPPGVSASEILDLAETSIADLIQSVVLAPIPDTVTFDEVRFRTALEQSGGPETLERLDYIRVVMDEGWTYTHHDLRADLSDRDDAEQALDSVRSFFGDGYSHTYRPHPVGGTINRLEETLDRGRELAEIVRRYQWIAYLMAPLLLVAVGLLGGVGWRGRVLWMSSTLLISAVMIFLISWPLQDVLADTVIEQSGIDVSGPSDGSFEATSRLLSGKWIEFVEAFSEEFVGGIRLYTLSLAGVAAAVLLTALFWRRAGEYWVRIYGPPNLSPGGGVR